jgi:DNA-directed RNA polymerase specialized sigma24 family protein
MSCEAARKAITLVYDLPEIDNCINKLVKQELRQDFKQELFLVLLQTPCEVIVKLNGSLKYYMVRIILNFVRQKRNSFYYTYLDKTIEYNTDKISYQTTSPADVDTIQERAEREQKEEEIINRLTGVDIELGNKSYPYHEQIIKLLAQFGSLRKVEQQTGIPKSTIHATVSRVRKHLTNE